VRARGGGEEPKRKRWSAEGLPPEEEEEEDVYLVVWPAGRRRRARRFATRRSVSLTSSGVGNSAATSGGSTTTLLPSWKRAAYSPRAPPLKSYSGRISASALLMVPAPAWRSSPNPDDPDGISTIGVPDDQQPPTIRETDRQTAAPAPPSCSEAVERRGSSVRCPEIVVEEPNVSPGHLKRRRAVAEYPLEREDIAAVRQKGPGEAVPQDVG
jgi:hypothetical protein